MARIESVSPDLLPRTLPATVRTRPSGGFAETLRGFLQEVNALQLRAGDLTEAFARGEVRDLHEVVLAQQEAAASLRLLLQMRDRIVAAYQEIMRMPV